MREGSQKKTIEMKEESDRDGVMMKMLYLDVYSEGKDRE